MSFECIKDPVLCPMEGRCPACTCAYLRNESAMLRKEVSRYRGHAVAFEWAVHQLERKLLGLELFRAVRFCEKIRANPDTDPALLELLKDPA